ncbi:MAG TPA: hypothetical protein DDZ89_06740, partial [Clostridiales bacterium]|nr:hypothetical protein [Clostridiales bacterium]
MKNKLNNMLMKILVLVILFLQMNPLSAVCAYNGVPPKTGSWLMWRNDKANTGMQNLPGEIVTPEQLKSIFMKGAVAGQPFFSDINHDNQPEIFFIDSGKVVAMDIYGSIAWSSDFILANTIYCVDDMDNDRRKEILTHTRFA